MKHLKSFEQLNEGKSERSTENISKDIVSKVEEKGYKCEDVVIKDGDIFSYLMFYVEGKCPFTVTYTDRNKTMILIAEIDGITDTLRSVDISKVDVIVDAICNFDVEKYKDNN